MVGLGATISLAGVFISSLTVSVGPYLACYCILNGLGCGMCYLVPLICGWEWFPESRGIVSGMTLCGYGFGSFIFSQVSTHLVNPNNEKADPNLTDGDINFFAPEVADRVPYMIQTLVYIWCGLAFVAVCLISRKPKERTETLDFLPHFGTGEENYDEIADSPDSPSSASKPV